MLVVQAGRFAREFGHSYVGTEHLLLAISEEAGGAGRVLRAVGMEELCLRSMVLAGAGIGSRTLFLPQGLSPRARRAVHQAGVEAGRLHARQASRRSICCSHFCGTTAVQRAGFYRKTARNSIACLRKPMERCMRGRSRSRGGRSV